MEEYLHSVIETTINSFDFALVISVNILTYLIIKVIDELNGEKELNKWIKRGIMLLVTIIISIVYSYCDFCDNRLILNSAILAPVFWRWLGKPIIKRFGIDYNRE